MSDEKQMARSGEERDQRGRFLPGHPGIGGRPKGSRQKLGEQFFADLQRAWEAKGPGVIESVLADRPSDLLKVVASLMPKEVSVEMTNQEDALRELDDSASEESKP